VHHHTQLIFVELGGLTNFFQGLASNHIPSDLYLLSCWAYSISPCTRFKRLKKLENIFLSLKEPETSIVYFLNPETKNSLLFINPFVQSSILSPNIILQIYYWILRKERRELTEKRYRMCTSYSVRQSLMLILV
jgi:hypothetical protein